MATFVVIAKGQEEHLLVDADRARIDDEHGHLLLEVKRETVDAAGYEQVALFARGEWIGCSEASTAAGSSPLGHRIR